MSDEFKEDIGKTAQFFMKTGRTYTGKIENVSKNNFIKITDIKNKFVRLAEDDISSSEIDKEV